ncbi:MAG: transcription factor [Conexivisphaerales archaeon]
MVKLEYEDTFVKVAGILGDDDYIRVARALLNNPDATDEEIASATGLKINKVRKVLYDLFERGLIAGIKDKDPKKGWFMYRWKIQQDQVEVFLNKQRSVILRKLQERLDYERSHTFYWCGTPTCKKYIFEEAIELFFVCPECGNPLKEDDNKGLIEALEWKIRQIEQENAKNNKRENLL